MLNILKNTINRVFASGVDSDASAFITATGLSGTTQKSAITTLVKDLKASGLWSKMKAVYPMVTDNYNLLSYTEDFSNAAWTKSGATVSANDIIAPNGTLTADKIVFGASNNYIYQSASSAINTCTQSIYIKGTAGETISFDDLFTYIPLVTLTGDWQRISWSSTNGSPHGLVVSTAQGATARTVWVWGGQIQLGNTLSTYQPIATTPSAFMASQMKYNLKDARDLDAAFRLTWSGGWTYSATGATPNGTNAYADTKFSPSANLNINSSHLSIYSRTAIGNLPQSDMGSYTTSTTDALTIAIAYSNVCYMGSYAFNAAANYIDFANTDSRGLYINTRTSANSLKGFKNNTIGDTSTTSVNGVLPSVNTIIGAESFNGVPTSYSTKQYAFASIGNGLTDQDALLLNQIVEKYQVALSRGVQAAQSFYYNSAYSNEANTYLYSTQITGTTQVSAINTLINGLKANNLWSKMKAVYPFVTDYRNLLGYTEDFTNGYWISANATTTANSTTSPTGTNTADTLTETSATGAHGLSSDVISFTSGVSYAFSIYAKNTASGRGFIQLAAWQITASNQNAYCNFDLINGVVGGSGNATGQIQDVGNGWYRCTMVVTSGKTYSERYNVFLVDNINATSLQSYAGNATKGIYIWGSQLEIGTSASAYQPILAANSSSTFMSSQMKFNLVNPQDSDAAFRLAFSGGWTYSTNGALPNGTNAYADTFLIPSTNLTESSKHLSVYIRTDNTPINADPINIGALNGTPRDLLGATRTFLSGQLSSIDVRNNSITNPIGYSLVTRSSTTNNLFKNNSKVGTLTGAGSSPTNKVFVGALNLNGGGYGYTNNQLALASIGDGLSDAEALILYNLIQQYQTDLSRQV